jgi:hypothetical protein
MPSECGDRFDAMGNPRPCLLVNTNSGKCVDVAGNGTADGTNVQLFTCNGTFAVVNTSSNKMRAAAGSRTAGGTNVQLWICNGTNAPRSQSVKR